MGQVMNVSSRLSFLVCNTETFMPTSQRFRRNERGSGCNSPTMSGHPVTTSLPCQGPYSPRAPNLAWFHLLWTLFQQLFPFLDSPTLPLPLQLRSIHVASLQGGRTFDQTHGHLAQANPSHSLLLMAEWWRVRS